MDIIRSDNAIPRSTAWDDVYTGLKGLSGLWSSTDDTNKRLYVTADRYIDLATSGAVKVHDATWNGDVTAATHNSDYVNFSVYKYSADCFGLSFAGASNKNLEYSSICSIIVDSYTRDSTTGKMIVVPTSTANVVKIADGYNTNNIEMFKPFDSQYSIRTSYTETQVADLIDPVGGCHADNVKGILFAPLHNCLTSMQVNGSTAYYLLTNGFAIPCGADFKYIYL